LINFRLALDGGRSIEYAETGDPNSDTLVIFFHGLFSIGHILPRQYSPVLRGKPVHFLAPTLPGWGGSSSAPPTSTFLPCLLSDVSALISHVHPDTSKLKLYIGGGSFGTAPAQMVYGAPYDSFPLGRHIVGVLLMAPWSPFRLHSQYGQSLTWANWIAVGPLPYYIPFKLLPRIFKLVLSPKFRTVEGAESFMHESLFDKMDEHERGRLTEWCESRNMTADELIRSMSENAVKSVEKTWDGFLSTCDILHSDWGFELPLDDDHSRARVFVVTSTADDQAGRGMADFIVENYKNARLKVVEGGHIAALTHIDDIWSEFLV